MITLQLTEPQARRLQIELEMALESITEAEETTEGEPSFTIDRILTQAIYDNLMEAILSE